MTKREPKFDCGCVESMKALIAQLYEAKEILDKVESVRTDEEKERLEDYEEEIPQYIDRYLECFGNGSGFDPVDYPERVSKLETMRMIRDHWGEYDMTKRDVFGVMRAVVFTESCATKESGYLD